MPRQTGLIAMCLTISPQKFRGLYVRLSDVQQLKTFLILEKMSPSRKSK
jgi:hypothetical protein